MLNDCGMTVVQRLDETSCSTYENIFLQMSIIFVDMEGAKVEELAAIQMSAETRQIMSVYHNFAKPECSDEWARRHCHGLDKNYLMTHAPFRDEHALIEDFRHWLRGKNVLAILANDPKKERNSMHWRYTIRDMDMPRWEVRDKKASHDMALSFKKSWVPVLNHRCHPKVHGSFRYVPCYRQFSKTEQAKRRWGVHCALYDCLECYFAWVESAEEGS